MRKLSLVIAAILVAVLAACGDDPPSEAAVQASVIDVCQDAAKKGLRDPESAQFDGWTAQQASTAPPAGMEFHAGDKYYSAGGQVNAKNGFGGYAGDEPYACDAVVTSDGRIHARSHPTASGTDVPN